MKAIKEITTRSTILKGATVATAAGLVSAAALRSTIASPAHDPIFALIANADRIRAEAIECGRLADKAEASVNGDCCGLPTFPEHLPIFQPMKPWMEAARGWEPGGDVMRCEIVQFNDLIDGVPVGGREAVERRKQMGKERLAWWDADRARRDHNAEVSGYRALNERADKLWDQHSDVLSDIYNAEPITIAGAMAQLRVAIAGIRVGHTFDGEFQGDFDNYGVFNAYDALARLLPAELTS